LPHFVIEEDLAALDPIFEVDIGRLCPDPSGDIRES